MAHASHMDKANLPTLTNQPSLRNSDNLVSRTSAEPNLSQSLGTVGTRGPCERRPAWEGGERPLPSPGERGTLSSVCSLPSGTLSPPAPPDCHVTVMWSTDYHTSVYTPVIMWVVQFLWSTIILSMYTWLSCDCHVSLRHCIYSVKEYLNAAFFCLRLHQSSAHCHTHTRHSVQHLKQGKFQTETEVSKFLQKLHKPAHSPKCESLKWQCLDFLQTLPTSAKSGKETKNEKTFWSKLLRLPRLWVLGVWGTPPARREREQAAIAGSRTWQLLLLRPGEVGRTCCDGRLNRRLFQLQPTHRLVSVIHYFPVLLHTLLQFQLKHKKNRKHFLRSENLLTPIRQDNVWLVCSPYVYS